MRHLFFSQQDCQFLQRLLWLWKPPEFCNHYLLPCIKYASGSLIDRCSRSYGLERCGFGSRDNTEWGVWEGQDITFSFGWGGYYIFKMWFIWEVSKNKGNFEFFCKLGGGDKATPIRPCFTASENSFASFCLRKYLPFWTEEYWLVKVELLATKIFLTARDLGSKIRYSEQLYVARRVT